ncbi:MAG: cytidylate kinase-like family protein [Candidatus Eremiobacteraeota bacterium]|nr:cytidylate kinase-like family protein [Candidatus Eremiobacteraeota bacterium]MBV8331199.1 cytidylate kinase-like family protein [Candidatus Eremiobacteraeota bacterium]MBV8433187.1 cytidylate kinase-like family protein [Candidatus Eremiobacteraeota bacterium]MBV8654872.1 cytidylate kinase-like family protein [Candidatus Eremiobacteraeota bacterium]MBV8721266.1 cytidylate kinase-like family protein [Candidatus Eremiobacteraeota bacterium]
MIVTISNEYGCGALAIAQRVATELGYEYVDRQLPVVVAKRLNVSPEDVEANEDTGRSLGERWLTSLERATPELAQASTVKDFDEEMLAAVQDAVREYAAHGNVVLIGRGAGTILGPRDDVLRVFMYAPRQWRIAHIAAATSVDTKTAEAEVDRVDRARAAYLRDWYGAAFGDPHAHDLCIDTSRISDAARLIVSAANERKSRASD